MRIITWNINSVRLRIELIGLLQERYNPDIILLQETKTENQYFPSEACANYSFKHQYFEGEKSYNGVAILSKIPFDEKFSLKFYNNDKRHVSVKIQDLEIHNFYIPSGGDIPDPDLNPKFKHKLAYLDEMGKWFSENRNLSSKILLAGDLNISPLEHDVWSSKALRFEVSHTDIERQIMMNMIKEFEWRDIAREFVPHNEKLYSWWSYRNRDWKKSNRGRRLDHIWLNNHTSNKATNFEIIREARDWDRPSDHVPVLIDL